MIPKYGIEGAALVTTLSYALGLVLSLVYLKKSIQFKISIKSWLKILIAGLFILLIIDVLRRLVHVNLWIELILFSLISLVVYVVLLFIFRVTSIKETKDFFNKVK